MRSPGRFNILLVVIGALIVGNGLTVIAGIHLPDDQTGDWYYAFAGAGLVTAGAALATSCIWTLGWHALFLFVSLQWAIAEVGLSFTSLAARIVPGLLVGAMLLTPSIGRRLRAVPANCAMPGARIESVIFWNDAAPAALAGIMLLSTGVCVLTLVTKLHVL